MITMINKAIGQPEHQHRPQDAVNSQCLGTGAARAAENRMLLERDQGVMIRRQGSQQFSINGFDTAHIHDRGV